jgi:hypothetical protein
MPMKAIANTLFSLKPFRFQENGAGKVGSGRRSTDLTQNNTN